MDKRPSYSITAIIPAYNEKKRIRSVLHTIRSSPCIHEVICINDGSTDNTRDIVHDIAGVKLINFKKNHGKAYAIAHGINKAHGDIVAFFDGDLKGLNGNHIKKLVEPLIRSKADIAVGYRYCNHLDKLFYPLSGERAYFKKDLVPYLRQIEKKGYGLELYLNYLFKNKRTKLFPLRGLRHTLKYDKQEFDIAAKMTLIEGIDILSEIVKQNNQVSHVIKSYLYDLYMDKSVKVDYQINRLTRYIKKILITKLF